MVCLRPILILCCAWAASASAQGVVTPRIRFHASNDSLRESARALDSLWVADGSRITAALQRASGLSFVAKGDTSITAVIVDDIPDAPGFRAFPIQVNAKATLDASKERLVRLLAQRLHGHLFRFDEDDRPFLSLWFHDALAEAYGPRLARSRIDAERRDGPHLRTAWDIALALSRRARAARWDSVKAARRRAAAEPSRPCGEAFDVNDITDWKTSMGLSVAVSIRHPARYVRRIWERVSDSTKRYLEIQKDGRVTNSRVVIQSSDDVTRARPETDSSTRFRRCALTTGSGTFDLWYGRSPLGRCTGCPPPDSQYAIIMRIRNARTGEPILFLGTARDSLDFREQLVMATTLRLLTLPP
jgi:hypothetical protein